MKPTETTELVAYISQGCPQQAIDEFTADVWHDLLGEYELAECIDAARAVMRRQPFVAPSEIITEVTAARRIAAGKRRRALLDAQLPQVALCPGDSERRARLLREEIDGVFAAVPRAAISAPAREPIPERVPADVAGVQEAERQRQMAALEAMASELPDVTDADIYEADGGDTMHDAEDGEL